MEPETTTQSQPAQPVETDRTRQLKALVGQYSPSNPLLASQMKASRDLQLQQAIGAAPARGVSQIAPTASALGAAQTANQVAANEQVAKANQAGLVQAGQIGLANQGLDLNAAQAGLQASSANIYSRISQELSNLDTNLSNQLLDKQLQFARDAEGRTILNEQQMLDYAVTKAKNSEELANYRQSVDQAWSKKSEMLKAANAKIEQVLQSGYLSEKQALDEASKKALEQQKLAVETSMRDTQNRAANQQAKLNSMAGLIGGLGTVGAAVAFANPVLLAAAPVAMAASTGLANVPTIRKALTGG